MRQVGLAFTALLALFAGTATAGEVDLERGFWSEALGRELPYGVYLADSDGRAALPVVYLLHGYGASHREWVEFGRIDKLLDELIEAGAIAPLIAIMPTSDKSWYVDSAARGGPGDYATAIAQELVAHVEEELPVIPGAAHRAVMGLSMGGFGALVLGLGDPGRFDQVVALSPAVFVPEGLSWERWSLGTTLEERDIWFPGVFGTPFDINTYRDEQPTALLDRLEGPPPRVLLASGDQDGFGFELGTVELFLALRRHDVPAALRIDAGDHDWAYWREATAEAFVWLDAGWPEQP